MTNFAKTLKLLADAGVRFVVVGGYAAMLHGSAYVTQDLDICYERTPAIIRSKRAAGRPKDLNALPELEALQELSARRTPDKEA